MKSKLPGLLVILMLCTGCNGSNGIGGQTSFRAQLGELVQQRDSGLITEHEYRSSKSRILSIMLH
jgi:hypothetical protein